MVDINDGWWVDFGATCKVIPRRSAFISYKEIEGDNNLFMGGTTTSKIIYCGTINFLLSS